MSITYALQVLSNLNNMHRVGQDVLHSVLFRATELDWDVVEGTEHGMVSLQNVSV